MADELSRMVREVDRKQSRLLAYGRIGVLRDERPRGADMAGDDFLCECTRGRALL
jgi:hypothetical protein